MKAVRMALEKKQPFARKAAAVGSKTAEVSVAHTGQWRDHEHGGLRFRCSKPGLCEEGPFCAHGDGIIPVSHWSCCGARQEASSFCKSEDEEEEEEEEDDDDADERWAVQHLDVAVYLAL